MMFFQKIRITCIVLLSAIILTAAFFSACKSINNENSDNSVSEPASSQSGQTGDTTEPATQDYLDTLPADDYGGYTFKIIAQHYDARPNFPAETETGEPMNDALYKRNRQLEQRFNITIQDIAFEDRGKVRDNVNKSVKAQDHAYDMIITSMADGINSLSPSGMLADLNSLNYIQLDQTWWCKSMYETMQINGKIFYTTGPLSPFFYYTPEVFVYNKTSAANYDIGDMNQLVLDNQWTADKLMELVKNKNKDLDGDGVMTDNDFYGLAHDNGVAGQALFVSFGQKMTVNDSTEYFKLNFDDEQVINIINKCAQILSDPVSTYNGTLKKYAANSELTLFMDGKSLFLISAMNNIIERFRAMNDDYGILPLPKLDSSQSEYVTLGNPWGPCGIAVPAYCDDPERTGLIMETMAYMSYEMVKPAMYDIIIQQKIARDESSQKMLDIIYSNFYFDLDTIHDFGGSATLMRDCACGVKTDFVSNYDKIRGKAEDALKKLVDAYLTLK
ncbi:MAG: hypothetical protein FWD71_01870 [Oscillospiraceae bacterium]|nr:hypothetical protein [Oscillospiraceae bacterium]